MLFGSSGIRKQYDRTLLDLALKVGATVGSGAGRVVVGMDTRTTGPVMAHAFISGALAAGSDVLSAGIAPTPTVAYGVQGRADAGCIITASHNPEPYNGMKLFNPDGSSFMREQQSAIENALDSIRWRHWGTQGVVTSAELIRPHMDAISDAVSVTGSPAVILDCGNGAGCRITPLLLTALGVRPQCLNCNISGKFSRPSEPLEAHVPHIGRLVREQEAAGAIIHDGDADRMMAFDRKGRYIRGDHLLMLFAQYLGARRIVTTVEASMAIEEIGDVHRTPVGDSHVSEHLLSWGDFGGEPSGSWIFPQHSLCPDGIYAAALFCEIASEWDIAAAIDGMPDYPIIRTSIQYSEPADLLLDLGAEVPTDGIRLEADDGWCLVRASGTEPKVRITAEGRTRTTARMLSEKGMELINTVKRNR
jgi:phosphoglucosamine mutase